MLRFDIENSGWPDVPFFQYYLLENFIPLTGLLAGLCVLGFVLRVAIRRPWTTWLVRIVLVLVIVVPVLAMLVKTPRERMRSATAELLHVSTPKLDTQAMAAFFAPELTIKQTATHEEKVKRDDLLAELYQRVGQNYTFSQAWINALDARQLGPERGESEIVVTVKVEGSGYSYPSQGHFRLHFVKSEKGWLIDGVTFVTINRQVPEYPLW